MKEVLIFFTAHWYLSLFTQSFFHHRYAAHAMFSMNKFWERFFHVLSFLFQGASFLSPYAYGVMHRMHHAYADTEKDPHSPKYDDNLFKMMWKTKLYYSNIFKDRMEIEPQFLRGVPRWKIFDYVSTSWPMRMLWISLYSWFYVYFLGDQYWWLYALLPVQIMINPVHGAIINWFAHKVGYTNFKVSDTSKNLLPVDFLMLGEGYHNNHYKNGTSPNFGVKWHEFDPIYPFIKLFNLLGIIKIRYQEELVPS